MGFQHMSEERKLAIQRKGNKALREKGKSHSYNSEEAKKAADKRWDKEKTHIKEQLKEYDGMGYWWIGYEH